MNAYESKTNPHEHLIAVKYNDRNQIKRQNNGFISIFSSKSILQEYKIMTALSYVFFNNTQS